MARRGIADFTTSLLATCCSCALGSVILLMVLLVPFPGAGGDSDNPHHPSVCSAARLGADPGGVGRRRHETRAAQYRGSLGVAGPARARLGSPPLFTSQRTTVSLSLGQGAPSTDAVRLWEEDIGGPDYREDVPGLGLVCATRTLALGEPWEDKSMGSGLPRKRTTLRIGAEVIEIRLTLGPGMEEPWPLHVVAVLRLSGILRILPDAVGSFLAKFRDSEEQARGRASAALESRASVVRGTDGLPGSPKVEALILPEVTALDVLPCLCRPSSLALRFRPPG